MENIFNYNSRPSMKQAPHRESVAESTFQMSVLSGVKNLRNDLQDINEDFFALGLNTDQSLD